jgi:hypothetical protein
VGFVFGKHDTLCMAIRHKMEQNELGRRVAFGTAQRHDIVALHGVAFLNGVRYEQRTIG